METFVIGSDNDEFYKADKTDATQFDTGSGKKEIVERLETCIFFCPPFCVASLLATSYHVVGSR